MHDVRRNSNGETLPPRTDQDLTYDDKLAGEMTRGEDSQYGVPLATAMAKPARSHMEQTWRILVGDVREKLRELPDQSVQTCVTSPPYWGLRDYGMSGQIGRESVEADYIAALADVSDAVASVLRVDGTYWLNIGDRFDADEGQRLLPHRVAWALMSRGWFVRCDVVWRKTRWMPNGGFSRPILTHEYVFMLTRQNSGYYYDSDALREPHSPVSLKRWESSGVAALGAPMSIGHKKADGAFRTKKVTPNPLGKLKTSVWDICPSDYEGAHFATMPEDLAETCIKASSRQGDLVLDPFTGSGTTGAVAIRLGRSFVGVELNPQYVALAEQRIGSAAPLFASGLSTSLRSSPAVESAASGPRAGDLFSETVRQSIRE